jgi:hypothetical protein
MTTRGPTQCLAARSTETGGAERWALDKTVTRGLIATEENRRGTATVRAWYLLEVAGRGGVGVRCDGDILSIRCMRAAENAAGGTCGPWLLVLLAAASVGARELSCC